MFLYWNCTESFKYFNVFSLLVIMYFAFRKSLSLWLLLWLFLVLSLWQVFYLDGNKNLYFPAGAAVSVSRLSTTPYLIWWRGVSSPKHDRWGVEVLPQRHLESSIVTRKLNLRSGVFPLDSTHEIFNSVCNDGLCH